LECLIQLQEAKKAYQKASLWNLIQRAYSASLNPDRTKLWLSSVFVLTAMVLLFIIKTGRIAENIFFVSMLLWVLSLKAAVRSGFAEYYRSKTYSLLLKGSNNDIQFLRFLMFRSHLPQKVLDSPNHLSSLRELLRNESDLASTSIISQHPVTVVCVGFLTAILGGGASQPLMWSSGIMWVAIGILAMVLYINTQLTDMIKPKSYKLKELQLFLYWLSLEEDEWNNGLQSDEKRRGGNMVALS
jgi:hypothetical protein